MQVKIAVLVGVGNLFVVHPMQPIVGGNRTRVVQNQPADRVIDAAVFVDAPVALVQIAVHRFFDVQHQRFPLAQAFVLMTVQNISLRHISEMFLHERLLDNVLNFFDGGNGAGVIATIDGIRHLIRETQQRLFRMRALRCQKRLLQGVENALFLERNECTVAFDNGLNGHG